jgi:FMN phosphatase YigB (HAD superfamily)
MTAPFLSRPKPRNARAGGPLPPGRATRGECHPHELPGVLDWFAGIDVLSLDCFDTLLWRDCHAPTDLFAALPAINAFQRMHGEQRARHIAHARGVYDVTLDEIYRSIMPNAAEADRARAIAAEIALEAEHCHGFAPAIALMREARRRGLSVILVSDTYFSAGQLQDLIARAAGAEVAALIDRIFVSSAHGLPKAAGLYREVLARLKARPETVLHIGDNPAADVEAVRPFGVRTLHLKQFTPRVQQQLRQESAISALLFGHDPQAIQAPQPHRPALAMDGPRLARPAQQFGFATLGPVLFGFDRWLRDEARALAADGGTVHWLFVMRDGYLPLRMHQALGPVASAQAIEISRLTATFATFAHDPAILRYLDEQRGVDPAILARQLRLPADLIARLCGGVNHAKGWAALCDWCRLAENRRPIVAAAQALAQRLIEHVRRAAHPAPGDTLMLVDLGYSGTVQSLIDPLLREALNVHVAGRYLILREVQATGQDKQGYLGADQHDHVLLNAMTANVSLIEQLCTTAQGSVIDYHADGRPLRDVNLIGKSQGTVREEVQQGCLAFAGAAPGHVERPVALWRRAAAATLMRLMFLPLREELAVVRAFEHDVNLGSSETLALFDPAVAHEGLLSQGLFYQKGARRMFLPAELAEEGMPARLTHLVMQRFHLPLAAGDFAADTGLVPVILSDADKATRVELPVRPTHDGYQALCIPVGTGQFVAAIPFAAVAAYVEVHAVFAMPAREYLDGRHDTHRRQTRIVPQLEGITALTEHLWHCPNPGGFALLQPPQAKDENNLVIVVVFRAVGEKPRGQAAMHTN